MFLNLFYDSFYFFITEQSTPHENFSKRDVEVARLRRPGKLLSPV